MRLSFLIFSLSCHHVLQLTLADNITVTRHADGDVFTIPGHCKEACMVISSDTASPYGSAPSAFIETNNSCTCQCNNRLPIFREDLRICVDNIQECDVTGFVDSFGLVQKVPYVFLPQSGQIIYPEASIKFEGVESPVCIVTGVQQLGKNGWTELRNISDVEFPLSLYRDKEHTFLQWTGEAKLREAAEGKIIVVKLACRDAYPAAAYRGVFTPCVSFRVAGSPSRSSIKEVSFSTSVPQKHGLTTAEYTAIGISSVVLALIYVASVSLYLHSRKIRRRKIEDEERRSEVDRLGCNADDNEAPGLVKCNPLLSVSRHFESDTNSAGSEAELADKLLQSETESDIEKVTSAIIHPHEEYVESQEHNCNSGSIIGERLPEEDVRVVETTDNGSQHSVPVFPGTQRRKLYFNPAYFERQLLLAPPPAAVEFLLKIREVISIAKHKMSAKRFVPTLNEIPEESSSESRSIGAVKTTKRYASSVQNGVTIRNPQKSLRCTGCPGCNHGSSTPNLPTIRSLADSSTNTISGESRVRAWLEDVKLLDTRWRNLEEERASAKPTTAQLKQLQQQQRMKLIKTRETKDVDTESAKMSSKSLPPLFDEISCKKLNGTCLNGILEGDQFDRYEKRYTRSVACEPGYFDRQTNKIDEWTRRSVCDNEENTANVNVRKAIENSFKQQLEQLKNISNKNTNTNRNENDDRTAEKTIVHSSLENVQLHNNVTNSNNHKNKTSKSIEKKINAKDSRVLMGIINNELSIRSNSDAKRIMDAVIKELVVAKEMEKDKDVSAKASDYETDSLEKTKVSRKSSSSPVFTNKSSPAPSNALPMDEELTMRNAIIDVQISETLSTKTSSIVKKHNLPEIVPLRPENYALVSEVYVNDGYSSPTGSDDDSGPEIQYELENPGHLTIKVLDSPNNYIKQDESEYEPDTLDRKPMKLKINDEATYEKDIINEVYVDSLERSSQILLRSKTNFTEDKDLDVPTKPPREYNSLREIYEARLKYQQQQQQQQEAQQINECQVNQSDSWYNNSCKCTSPLLPRHERRQRKADNPPDVVPKPPPSPSPEIQSISDFAKNAHDRSLAVTGDPTTCKDAPVIDEAALDVGKSPAISEELNDNKSSNLSIKQLINDEKGNTAGVDKKFDYDCKNITTHRPENLLDENEERNEKSKQYHHFSKWRGKLNSEDKRSKSTDKAQRKSNRLQSRSESHQRCHKNQSIKKVTATDGLPAVTLEDSAYMSSPDSNGSDRRLLYRDSHNSCTESDESTSGNGANSESGAESIETDSVFFGNFCARTEREKLADYQTPAQQNKLPVLNQQHQQRSINYQAFQIKSRVY